MPFPRWRLWSGNKGQLPTATPPDSPQSQKVELGAVSVPSASSQMGGEASVSATNPVAEIPKVSDSEEKKPSRDIPQDNPKPKLSSLGTGLSLKSLNVVKANTISQNDAKHEPLNQQRLEEVWKDIIKAKSLEDSPLASIMEGKKLEVVDDDNFMVVVHSPIFESEVKPYFTELMTMLRKRLNNGHVKYTLKMTTAESAYVPYSAKEKFDYMMKQNPAMDELRKIFEQIDL